MEPRSVICGSQTNRLRYAQRKHILPPIMAPILTRSKLADCPRNCLWLCICHTLLDVRRPMASGVARGRRHCGRSGLGARRDGACGSVAAWRFAGNLEKNNCRRWFDAALLSVPSGRKLPWAKLDARITLRLKLLSTPGFNLGSSFTLFAAPVRKLEMCSCFSSPSFQCLLGALNENTVRIWHSIPRLC